MFNENFEAAKRIAELAYTAHEFWLGMTLASITGLIVGAVLAVYVGVKINNKQNEFKKSADFHGRN